MGRIQKITIGPSIVEVRKRFRAAFAHDFIPRFRAAFLRADSRLQQAKPTTIKAIRAGKFKSASDKKGTRGSIVEVIGVTVAETPKHEADGDWHVPIRTSSTGIMAEIIPSHPLPIPRKNQIIDVIGVTYCDHVHEREKWHYDTCWEIHPILSWKKH